MAKSNRSDANEAIVKVSPNFLSGIVEKNFNTGLEEMQEYRILSRVKIIQGMSAQALKEEFGEGAVILSPANAPVCDVKGTFLFVPLFGFTEFCKWSDRKDKNSPAIQMRSFDKASEIAAKARNAERPFEKYGDPEKPFIARYVEHLNFAGTIYTEGHPLKGLPIVLSYGRGEFGTGKSFVTSMTLRRHNGMQVPMWAQVWKMTCAFRDRGDKKWWGIDHSNPEQPYILEDEIQMFYGIHQELKADYTARKLAVDRTDEEGEDDINLSGADM